MPVLLVGSEQVNIHETGYCRFRYAGLQLCQAGVKQVPFSIGAYETAWKLIIDAAATWNKVDICLSSMLYFFT